MAVVGGGSRVESAVGGRRAPASCRAGGGRVAVLTTAMLPAASGVPAAVEDDEDRGKATRLFRREPTEVVAEAAEASLKLKESVNIINKYY